MVSRKQRRFSLLSVLLASVGCFLIGFSVVFPIFFVSGYTSYYAREGPMYQEVVPISGTVSETSGDWYHTFAVYGTAIDITIEVRNFYTNNTPVTLILATEDGEVSEDNFFNQTAQPATHVFQIDDAIQLILAIRYAGNVSTFSGWAIYHGWDFFYPMMPPRLPVFEIISLFFTGSLFFIIGLYRYRVQQRNRPSAAFAKALILCTLGFLLFGLCLPSFVRPHAYLHYDTPQFTDFGEFTNTLTLAQPHANITILGLNGGLVELRGFFVTADSVTVHVYSLDGLMNYTWNFVNSQYPGYRTLQCETTGDTVIEVLRDSADTGFHCWVLVSHRNVEIRQHPAGNYAPLAFSFLVAGSSLLAVGLIYARRLFEESSKEFSTIRGKSL